MSCLFELKTILYSAVIRGSLVFGSVYLSSGKYKNKVTTKLIEACLKL